jgi:glyoxylase I family protein
MAVSCRDPGVIERFYSRHFGFRRSRVLPLGGEEIVFLRSGEVYLELFQAKGAAPGPAAAGAGPEYPGWRHLAFKVDDVDAKLAEMGEAAKLTLGPVDFSDFIPGWRTAWLADPEGNIVEISQGYMDQSYMDQSYVDEDAPPP